MIRLFEVKRFKYLSEVWNEVMEIYEYKSINENAQGQLEIVFDSEKAKYLTNGSLVDLKSNKSVIQLVSSDDVLLRGLPDFKLVDIVEIPFSPITTLIFEENKVVKACFTKN